MARTTAPDARSGICEGSRTVMAYATYAIEPIRATARNTSSGEIRRPDGCARDGCGSYSSKVGDAIRRGSGLGGVVVMRDRLRTFDGRQRCCTKAVAESA